MKDNKIRKYSGIFAIIVGFSIIILWTILFLTNQIPEINITPWSIAAHMIAELILAILLIISGIRLYRKIRRSSRLFGLASGALIYSIINASGYYAQQGKWGMVIFFILLLGLSASAFYSVYSTK